MSRQLLAILALVLILGAGVFAFYWQNRQKEVATPLPMSPVVEESEEPTVSYSQHIEAIPGNTDEVWYNIPEYGVRMKLNKEFAEDLIYRFAHEKNTKGEEWDSVYLTVNSLLYIDTQCSGALGGFFKIEGKVVDGNRLGYQESENFGQLIYQFTNYHIVWQGGHDVCWDPGLEKKVREVFPGKYVGSGAKNIREGMRTLELIPKK